MNRKILILIKISGIDQLAPPSGRKYLRKSQNPSFLARLVLLTILVELLVYTTPLTRTHRMKNCFLEPHLKEYDL
jgi:hypothetical protein